MPCRLSGTKNHHFAKLRFHDFQRQQMTAALPDSMPGSLADNSILSIVLTLVKQFPDTRCSSF
ncbi:hypothetical protein [Bathymodiolus japonicus methanotrophic gill symbiont]|uniref:hypothetical protein n=1 Tax=Bathymodiolus japonicus methanotrophic gill symbiont TaxID=113269 RepID=UPI001C8E1717|nr:hypothetical protein [Bathymodiolus japonicus methanotrophic gill symbiont]